VDFSFENIENIPFKPYPPRPEHCLSFYPYDTEIVAYADQSKLVSNVKSALIGQHNVVTNRYVGKRFCVIQVVFLPGALYRLTNIPSFELTNQYLDAEAIFSKDIKEVNAKLSEAPDHRKMIAIIEVFLLKLIQRSKHDFHPLDFTSKLMLQAKTPMPIEWLAKESYLSLRQYERKFMERMGIPPKHFNRIVRFENAYRLRNQHADLDWLSIAMNAGYYDYQHLAKDYKAFTSKTPIDFHALDLAAPERKFGEADTY
jgi:AraC-like DNA-binding protein